MIRKRSGRVTATQEIPTASLADISFCSSYSSFRRRCSRWSTAYRWCCGAGSATVKVKRSAVVVVRANPDGTIEIEKEPVPLGRLRAIIEAKLAENADLIVVLETHPDSEYGLMVTYWMSCASPTRGGFRSSPGRRGSDQERRAAEDRDPTASMADISFLLFIFFVSTTIFRMEDGLP